MIEPAVIRDMCQVGQLIMAAACVATARTTSGAGAGACGAGKAIRHDWPPYYFAITNVPATCSAAIADELPT